MATMNALTFWGPGDVRVEEVARPEVEEPGDVLLRIDRAAICGTDLHPYHGRMEIEEGFVLGHEYLGTIEAKGEGVTEFEEGERAVGSFFVNCGKCWFCRRGLPMKCMAIRVFGLGFAFGDLSGAQSQYMRVPEADHVVLDLTGWRGADVVVDAVGNEQALAACFPLVRMGGTISLPGMYVEDATSMPIGDMWLKNITIRAGVANIQGHMDEVIELIRDGRIDPKVMISHRLPLTQAPKGY